MIKDKGNSLERFLDLTFVVKPNASALAGSQAADAADPAVVRYGVPLQLKTKDGNELHKASGTVNKGYITSEKSASSSQPNILEVLVCISTIFHLPLFSRKSLTFVQSEKLPCQSLPIGAFHSR
jgi:hypothetical protein